MKCTGRGWCDVESKPVAAIEFPGVVQVSPRISAEEDHAPAVAVIRHRMAETRRRHRRGVAPDPCDAIEFPHVTRRKRCIAEVHGVVVLLPAEHHDPPSAKIVRCGAAPAGNRARPRHDPLGLLVVAYAGAAVAAEQITVVALLGRDHVDHVVAALLVRRAIRGATIARDVVAVVALLVRIEQEVGAAGGQAHAAALARVAHAACAARVHVGTGAAELIWLDAAMWIAGAFAEQNAHGAFRAYATVCARRCSRAQATRERADERRDPESSHRASVTERTL